MEPSQIVEYYWQRWEAGPWALRARGLEKGDWHSYYFDDQGLRLYHHQLAQFYRPAQEIVTEGLADLVVQTPYNRYKRPRPITKQKRVEVGDRTVIGIWHLSPDDNHTLETALILRNSKPTHTNFSFAGAVSWAEQNKPFWL